jgi:hypothetical protein
MPANQLRCDASVIPENDPTGEHAIECGAIAVLCIDCTGSAGCVEHAFFCGQCGRAVCEGCKEEHACQAGPSERRAV